MATIADLQAALNQALTDTSKVEADQAAVTAAQTQLATDQAVVTTDNGNVAAAQATLTTDQATLAADVANVETIYGQVFPPTAGVEAHPLQGLIAAIIAKMKAKAGK
jgi:hypothetical protein